MNVLHLGTFARGGGLERYVDELNAALSRIGTTSFTLGDVAPLPAGASVLARAQATRRGLTEARRRAGREGLLIASHFAWTALPVWPQLRRGPHVAHFHGPWADESRREGAGRSAVAAKRAVERAVYRSAGRVICLSRAFAEIVTRDYGVETRRVRVIPGGVDVERFAIAESRADARAALGWPAGRPVVVCVRRLVNRMGLMKLLDATALLRERVPDVLVVIGGRGPLSDALAARVSALNLQDHVRLLGFVEEGALPRVYRAANLSVVPSDTLEGFGLTTLESLAAGTPCLVSPVGGLPEAVGGLSESLTLPDTTAPTLARVLGDALRGTRPLPDATACVAYAREGFDWAHVARRVRAVYEEAVREHPV